MSAIITTCRRSPEFVSRALKSVLAQTYPRIQIIVVDDSPADFPERENVRRVVRELCPQAVFLSTGGKNLGAPAARNMGIRAADGEYVAFLDDDDEWLPDKIQDQISCFTDENTALVYGGCVSIEDTKHIRQTIVREWHSGKVYEQLLKSCFIGSTSIPLMRKSCVEAVGGFDEEMRAAQDYDLYLRLTQKYEFGYTQNVCVIYHDHEGARISTDLQAKISGHERLIRKYSVDLERLPEAWVYQHRILIPIYRRNGEIRKALKTWLSTVRKRPLDIPRNIKDLLLALFKPDFFLYRLYHDLKNHVKGLIRKT